MEYDSISLNNYMTYLHNCRHGSVLCVVYRIQFFKSTYTSRTRALHLFGFVIILSQEDFSTIASKSIIAAIDPPLPRRTKLEALKPSCLNCGSDGKDKQRMIKVVDKNAEKEITMAKFRTYSRPQRVVSDEIFSEQSVRRITHPQHPPSK